MLPNDAIDPWPGDSVKDKFGNKKFRGESYRQRAVRR